MSSVNISVVRGSKAHGSNGAGKGLSHFQLHTLIASSLLVQQYNHQGCGYSQHVPEFMDKHINIWLIPNIFSSSPTYVAIYLEKG